ncbi:TAF5-like RNA polymerase II p300/CBP-associated factor-associated factor 65 kDa subunit 5L [Planococcus citri]|uniref:TAF5-like RNA polymerase II p300/CBP-associated factor-associated factor 65 kDa subunit 5L n=1 Tax=Planococcus citri TaxID=170843 RepID=UPI0031F7DF52
MINVKYDVDNEMIDNAIELYLEKKRITEEDVLKNGASNLTQTPIKMLENLILDYHTSQNNTYIYSCTTQSITQMDTEFMKLKTWICDMENTKCKQELSQLLFPVFCHLYLDTLCESNGQHCQAAMIFFKRHQGLFTRESLRDIIKDIGNIFKKDEIENKPLIKAFRSAKCELRLSSTSATLLRNFISKCDEPMILLNVLNSWFVIEDQDNNIREDDDPSVCPESEMIMGQRVENGSPELMHDESDTVGNEGSSDSDRENDSTSDHNLDSLMKTFKNIRNSIPQPMPLLLLQMHNAQNITCSSVCYRSKLLTCGTLDSDIKTFSFSEENQNLPQARSLPVKLRIPNYDSSLSEDTSTKHFSVMRGHCGSVSSVKMIENPDIILSTSEDSTMRAWRRSDFSCVAVYKGHDSPVWGLDVSALNLYVATASRDRTARLWTLDKTYPLRLYIGHYDSVTCVKFHPNGIYLATGSIDKTVRLFSVIDGKTARVFTGHTGPVYCLSFSPDGEYLASAGDYKEVIVWNLALGQQYISVDTSSQFVCDLSWNLDSSVLAITFLKRYISLLYVQKKKKENEHNIIGKYDLPDNKFTSCQFLEKNNLVAVSIV